MNVRGESGQVLPMVTVMALGLLAMVGLVVDAGMLFAAKRDLQATADAAARAGAAVIDEDAYRSSEGRVAVLDPPAAERAAAQRLEDVQLVDISASDQAVSVRVSRTQPLLLLGIVGVGPLHVEAHSTARPRTGILEPEN